MLLNNEQSERNFILAALTPMLVIFLMAAPFAVALFNGSYIGPQGLEVSFERAIYTSLIWGAVLLALLCIYFIIVKKFRFEHDAILLFVFVIPLSFTISYFNAASQHFAEKELMVSLMYAAIFSAAYLIFKNETGKQMIQFSLMLSGYMIVLYGFFNLFGHMYFDQSVMLTDQGLRMTGIFQYANTYALFLMMILFICIHYILQSKKKLHVFLHGLMIVPILVSFLLTLSRGAWLIVPFALVLLMPFYKLTRQVAFIVYIVIGAAGAFLISSHLDRIGNDAVKGVLDSIAKGAPEFVSIFNNESLSGWGMLLFSSAIVAAIIFAIQTYVLPLFERGLQRLTRVKLSNLLLPVLGLLIGIVGTFTIFTENSSVAQLLPANLQERVANITLEHHSVQERFTFYRDAGKLIGDYPLVGAGGGAWKALYEKYQNNPYSSREAHSFFMQYMTEVGIVGFALFVLFIGIIFVFYIRTYIRKSDDERNHSLPFYIIVLSILLHSTIDFNMSYVYIGALLFIGLAGMAASVNWNFSWSKVPEKLNTALRFAFPVIAGILCIVLLVSSVNHVRANTLFYEFRLIAANGQTKSLQQLVAPLDKAMELDPNHPVYAVEKSRMLNHAFMQFKDAVLIEDNKKMLDHYFEVDPYNRFILEEYYNLYISENNLAEALDIILKGIDNFPWEITMYDRAIALYTNLASQEQDESVRMQYLQNILDIYDTVTVMQEHLETLPEGQMQGRSFNLDKNSLNAVNEVKAILDL